MNRPELPGQIAERAVKLMCVDQIKASTSIRNLDNIKWSQISHTRKIVKDNLLNLKDVIMETDPIGDVPSRWIEKIRLQTKQLDKNQLLTHVKLHMESLGFIPMIQKAAETYNNVMKRLKKEPLKKDHSWILHHYRSARQNQILKTPENLALRIQKTSEFPVESWIDRAQAEAAKHGLMLVAPTQPHCPVCTLIGHDKSQCLLKKEAAPVRMFTVEELRQQFQNDMDGLSASELELDMDLSLFSLPEDSQSTRSKHSQQSNSSPGDTEIQLYQFFHGFETSATGREHSILTFPGSMATTRDREEHNNTPEQDSMASSHCPEESNEAFVMSSAALSSASQFRQSTLTPTQLQSSQHYSSEEEVEAEWSLRSRSSSVTLSRSETPDLEDVFNEPDTKLGPRPCHVLVYFRRQGYFIQSKVYAKYNADYEQRQVKIGDIMQFYEKLDERMETQQGILQAAEAIKRFHAQSKESLIPTAVMFFHSSKGFTEMFDKGIKQPFKEMRRILSNQGLPAIYIQETDSSTTRTADEQAIAQKLYKEWNNKSPKFRKVYSLTAPAYGPSDFRAEPSLAVSANFVVVCGYRSGSTAASIFIFNEDSEEASLRTLHHDCSYDDPNSKLLSTKIIMIQACYEIASHIRRSKSLAHVGDILIVHGSTNIALDLQYQRQSSVFSETCDIMAKAAPQATVWFMKTPELQDTPSTDYSLMADISWKIFKSKDSKAIKNPVTTKPPQPRTQAQDQQRTSASDEQKPSASDRQGSTTSAESFVEEAR